MCILKTLLHSAVCKFRNTVVSAGPGMIYCVCDSSTLCPRKEGVRGGLGCGRREHIVPMVLLQCKPGFFCSLEVTLLHAKKKKKIRFLLGFSLATVEP